MRTMWNGIRVIQKIKRVFIFCLLLVVLSEPLYAGGTDPDWQSWNMARVTHVEGDWSFSLQYEVRLRDNMSTRDESIFKPYLHYAFSDRFGLSFGYKHINRPTDADEWEPWFELVFPRRHKEWLFSHQVRQEFRVRQGLDGLLPRTRYLFNYVRPLGDTSMYFTGFAAVRFNLDEKGEGPVSGFEQVRWLNGIGFHLGHRVRLELGYLYRYERNRDRPAFSDHVLDLQLFINTKRRLILRPQPNDHIR